jgi:hypothetical protein
LLRAHLLAVSFLVVVGKMRATVGKKKLMAKTVVTGGNNKMRT